MFTARSLLLFLFALIQAIVAVLIAEHWVAGKSVGTQPVPVAEQIHYAKVVVASRDIPQWQKIEASFLKEAEWPEKAVAPDMFTEITQAVGKVAIGTIYSGEALNNHRVVDPKGGSVFSLLIPESKRAFTIRVNDVSGVAGFLLPGNRVDVLATSGKQSDLMSAAAPGATAERHAETIVRNLKVLAIDQDANDGENKPQIVRSVTLEMTPKDAERIFEHEEGGSIRLTLRNPSEEAAPMTAGAGTISPRAAAPHADADERTYTIIRGLNASEGKCTRYACSE